MRFVGFGDLVVLCLLDLALALALAMSLYAYINMLVADILHTCAICTRSNGTRQKTGRCGRYCRIRRRRGVL